MSKLIHFISGILTIIVVSLFLWILGDIIFHGFNGLSWEFLSQVPLQAGRAGGIAPVLVSTLWILFVCLLVSIPLGLGTALLLAEFTSQKNIIGRLVRRSLDILSGVPSIVFGLFGNALFCQKLKMGFSILSGGLTLACMVLPFFIRAAEEGFRMVPREQRLGSAALGFSQTRMFLSVLLPLSMPGLIVGFVLSIGRALAETAALIFTSGYVDRFPHSVFDSGRTLSIHIYDLTMNVPGGDQNAYASALALVVLLLIIDTTAVWVSERLMHRTVIPL